MCFPYLYVDDAFSLSLSLSCPPFFHFLPINANTTMGKPPCFPYPKTALSDTETLGRVRCLRCFAVGSNISYLPVGPLSHRGNNGRSGGMITGRKRYHPHCLYDKNHPRCQDCGGKHTAGKWTCDFKRTIQSNQIEGLKKMGCYACFLFDNDDLEVSLHEKGPIGYHCR